jgi:hypothetical protein
LQGGYGMHKNSLSLEQENEKHYRMTVYKLLPRLKTLDGKDGNGNSVMGNTKAIIPGKVFNGQNQEEQYLEPCMKKFWISLKMSK